MLVLPIFQFSSEFSLRRMEIAVSYGDSFVISPLFLPTIRRTSGHGSATAPDGYIPIEVLRNHFVHWSIFFSGGRDAKKML